VHQVGFSLHNRRTDTENPDPPSGISMPNHERNEDVSYLLAT